MDSTSKPVGMTKLSRKMPARVMFTVGVGGQHGAVFAERERVLGFDAHVRLDGRGLQRRPWPSMSE